MRAALLLFLALAALLAAVATLCPAGLSGAELEPPAGILGVRG